MTASLALHFAHEIYVHHHDASNNNSIRLNILDSKGRTIIDLTLFDLPKGQTDKLLLAFADENTRDFSKSTSRTKDVAA